jgi:hypothetical protein
MSIEGFLIPIGVVGVSSIVYRLSSIVYRYYGNKQPVTRQLMT